MWCHYLFIIIYSSIYLFNLTNLHMFCTYHFVYYIVYYQNILPAYLYVLPIHFMYYLRNLYLFTNCCDE